MKINIFYSPLVEMSNQYCERIVMILSREYSVSRFSYLEFLKEFFLFNFTRHDIIVVNWFENSIVNKHNKVSLFCIVKAFLKLFVLKLAFKKIIFVRHNDYPHGVIGVGKIISKWITNILYSFANEKICHSIVYQRGGYKYVPHPLYHEIKPTSVPSRFYFCEKEHDLYVIFGRIVRYKKIEDIVRVFPENKRLIIAGVCEDLDYLNDILALTVERPNISILPDYISDEDARKLMDKAVAMIISHNNDEMLVSGSFFYALTAMLPVVCVETLFLKWAEETIGYNFITNCKDVNELALVISKTKEFGCNNECDLAYVHRNVVREFNDDIIFEKFKDLIEG